jgi:hypothetical protein
MKSWKGLVAQTDGREPGEFTRVRVARYCASQLPWFTGAILWLVLKTKFATKLAQITTARQAEAERPGCSQRAQIWGLPPNVGVEIENRMFHADRTSLVKKAAHHTIRG